MGFSETVVKQVLVPLSAKWERSNYLTQLNQLERSQYLDPSEVLANQWKCAKEMLNHAYLTCPYYRKRWQELGLHPDDIRDFSDFDQIPVLTREDVVSKLRDLISENYNVPKLIPGLTSGSTGKPLRFYFDFEVQQFRRACIVRNNRWAGWDMGRKVFSIYGDTPHGEKSLKGYLWNFLISRHYNLNSLRLTELTMREFHRKLAKVTKPFIYGHAHNLFVFAKFLKEKGLEDIEASGIISGGMNLVEWERKEIEQSFNCKVLNRYGCEELSLIASECSHQKGLHLNTDLHYVEILKMSPGDEFGTLIVTDLRNYAMPFIRYRVGDIGAFSETSCSCGRTQPLLKQLQGRESEFIVTPDSRLVSGVSLTDNFAGMIDGIIQLQIIQDKTDHLIFRIVPGESFAVQSLKSIESLVRKFFGEQMTFDCDITDTIPLDSSGKFRFVVSDLSKEYFETLWSSARLKPEFSE